MCFTYVPFFLPYKNTSGPMHKNSCTWLGGPSAWPAHSHSLGALRGCPIDGIGPLPAVCPPSTGGDQAHQGKAPPPSPCHCCCLWPPSVGGDRADQGKALPHCCCHCRLATEAAGPPRPSQPLRLVRKTSGLSHLIRILPFY
uniref:Uncharacterized protein n=1 Tax=Myotis myotis TaxID=51298 RepID=A0A7J7T644_MYOMY|nr:hypothetical protein mMyoMyo1_009242 [Myotis myotis]